jgi:hypothetical protein
MDRRLNNAPALAYIKDLTLWIVVNNKCEPIMWTDDQAELAWFSSILEYGANERRKLVVNNPKPKAVEQGVTRISPRPEYSTRRRCSFHAKSIGVASPEFDPFESFSTASGPPTVRSNDATPGSRRKAK